MKHRALRKIPLSIFILVFAALGAYLLWPTHAATPSSGNVAFFNRVSYHYSTSTADAQSYENTTLATASRYKVIVLQNDGRTGVNTSRPTITLSQDLSDKIHAASPGTQVLVYEEINTTRPGDGAGYTTCNTYSSGPSTTDANASHPTWFLYNQPASSGNQTASTRYYTPPPGTNYPGTQHDMFLNVSDSTYQQGCVQDALANLRAGDFDGVFLDDIDAWIGYYFPAAEGNAYVSGSSTALSPASYQSQMLSFLPNVTTALRNNHFLAYGNVGATWAAISGGSTNLWQQYGTYLDGSEEEGFSDTYNGAVIPLSQWQKELANVGWSEANGKPAVLHAYSSNEAGNTFGLGSMLLVANGKSSYQTSNQNTTTNENWYAEYDTAQQLGTPTGAYTTLTSGSATIYKRTFTNGIVLVNPTTSASGTFALNGSTSYTGVPCSSQSTATSASSSSPTSTFTSTSLLAHCGLILLKNGTPPPPPPAPTVSLSANPTSIASGASSTLSWNSTNATTCTASGNWSGAKANSGSTSTGSLATSQTYNLSCSGAGGSAQASANVSVGGVPPPPPAPTVSLSANPTSIASGASSTLSWNSSNAVSCKAGPGWTNSDKLTGSTSTGPLTASATYSITCTNSVNVTATATAGVTVAGVPPPTPITLGGGSSNGPPPTVSGNITLVTPTAGAKKVTYKVDGKTVTSPTINTKELTDGDHTVEAVITEPNGKVVTEKKIIKVDNHNSPIKNAMLKYGSPVTIGLTTGLCLALLVIAVWFLVIRKRPLLLQEIVAETEDIVKHPSHISHLYHHEQASSPSPDYDTIHSASTANPTHLQHPQVPEPGKVIEPDRDELEK